MLPIRTVESHSHGAKETETRFGGGFYDNGMGGRERLYRLEGFVFVVFYSESNRFFKG